MLFLRLGWRNLWRKPWRSLISIAAVASGLVFLILLLGMTEGLKEQMLANGTGLLNGHFQIHNPDYLPDRIVYDWIGGENPPQNWNLLLREIENQPEIESVAPRVIGFSLVSTGEHSSGAQLLGIDPAREPQVTNFLDGLVEGRHLSAEPDREVLLGITLAKELQADIGSEIAAVTQAADGSIGNDLYRVVGMLRLGMSALDRGLVVMHYQDVQTLLALELSQVHEVVGRVPIAQEAAEIVSRLNSSAVLPAGAVAQDWGDLAPQLKDYVGLIESFYGILIGFISFFAALGVLNTMMMAVFERTREFGMIGALGMAPRQILWTVLIESLVLVSVGVLVGLLLGALIMRPLAIEGIDLSRWTGDFELMNTRLDPVIRFVWVPGHITWSAIGMVISGLLASLLPARRIASMDPVKALSGAEGSDS